MDETTRFISPVRVEQITNTMRAITEKNAPIPWVIALAISSEDVYFSILSMFY